MRSVCYPDDVGQAHIKATFKRHVNSVHRMRDPSHIKAAADRVQVDPLPVCARLWSCADTKSCRESLLRGRGSSLDLSSQTGAIRPLLSALNTLLSWLCAFN